MKYTIYKTTNLINNKIYIGKHQTLDPYDYYLGSGKHLNHAINKYGRENFVKEVLHVFDNEADMNAKEKELVTEDFLARDDVYNLCPGGQGGFGYLNSIDRFWNTWPGTKLQHKTAINNGKTIGVLNLKRGHGNDIYKYKTFLGKSHSEEAKKKIGAKNSIAQSGTKNSQYGTMWITNGIENKKIKNIDIIPKGWYKGRK